MRYKFLLAFLIIAYANLSAQIEEVKVLLLMGSRFEIHVVADDSETATQHIESAINEIKRIEALISSWDSKSETSKINDNAGVSPVEVSVELYELIERSIKISELTKGAFDITAVVMNGLWKFDGSMTAFPSEGKVAERAVLIDYNNIILDREKHTVFLKQKGMKIGFGSIGKGYAAQSAANLLKNKGVNNGLINAAGDLYAWGTNALDSSWQIGIVDPKQKDKMYAWLDIKDMAVVTSGDYEKTIEFNGQHYSHILDPRSAYPVSNGLHSVTIISKNAEFADAMATGVFVLGEEVGLYLVNMIDGVDAILVNDKKEVVTSDNVNLRMRTIEH